MKREHGLCTHDPVRWQRFIEHETGKNFIDVQSASDCIPKRDVAARRRVSRERIAWCTDARYDAFTHAFRMLRTVREVPFNYGQFYLSLDRAHTNEAARLAARASVSRISVRTFILQMETALFLRGETRRHLAAKWIAPNLKSENPRLSRTLYTYHAHTLGNAPRRLRDYAL